MSDINWFVTASICCGDY